MQSTMKTELRLELYLETFV